MGGFRIEGTSNNVVDVTASGEVKAALSLVPANIGGVRMFSENDTGSVTGAPLLVSPETSLDYRLRTAQDSIMFSDEFNATAQNTAIYYYANTTMAMAQSGGFLVTNSGLSANTATGCLLQTRRAFTPVVGAANCVESNFGITAVPLAGQEFYIGLGIKTSLAVPSDGAFIKLNSDGMRLFNSVGGSIVESGVLKTPAQFNIGAIDKYALVVSCTTLQLWCNNVLLGSLNTPVGAAQSSLTTSLSLVISQHNTSAVAGSPQMQVKIGNVTVSMMDIAMNRTWAAQMADMGLMGYQGQNGGTMGQTCQWSNTALPAAAAGTNTTAALGSGLGGLFQLNAMATSATDVVVMNYANPVGTTTKSPNQLVIRGVWVDVTVLGAAVATTATVLALALAFGHTALSLATAESASFANNTAKAPRRLPIGTAAFKVGDVIGTSQRFVIDFEIPVIVNPGEFVALVAKPVVGTATASEVFLFNIGVNAHFE